jgi:hypothetical protein
MSKVIVKIGRIFFCARGRCCSWSTFRIPLTATASVLSPLNVVARGRRRFSGAQQSGDNKPGLLFRVVQSYSVIVIVIIATGDDDDDPSTARHWVCSVWRWSAWWSTTRRRCSASISAMDGLFREGVVPINDNDVSVLLRRRRRRRQPCWLLADQGGFADYERKQRHRTGADRATYH